MGTLVTFYCKHCGKEHQSYKQSSYQKYCSNACQMEEQRERKIRDWLNGEWKNNSKSLMVPKWQKDYLLENAGHKCEKCGVSNEWNGMPLTLQVDHIDGNASNNDIHNLMILCPNCHSQTDTYGNKGNRKSARKLRAIK